MFYEVFKKLCDDKGISPTKASIEIGFSKGSVSYWKKQFDAGKDAKPDSYTAAKIADYFHVSVDYLLGRTDDPTVYTDADLIAELDPEMLDHFDGDVRRTLEAQRTISEDAMRENAQRQKSEQAFLRKLRRLDDADRGKVEAFLDGLLASDKYDYALQTKNA